MTDDPIAIAGIFVPRRDAVFLIVLAVHVAAGLVCVVAGAVAMMSPKARGRHTRAGGLYYQSCIVVFLTTSVLAVLQWPHDMHLLALGTLSLTGAILGRRSVVKRGRWRIRAHILGMGASYTLLLIAFYVDNGRSLPLWKRLPSAFYWILPAVIAAPLIARAVRRHPLARAEREREREENALGA